MNTRLISQSGGGGFGGEVALRFAHQFITGHELLDGGGTEQWWKIDGVQLPVRAVLVAIDARRRTVPAHAVRERAAEQVVVPHVQRLHRVADRRSLGVRQLVETQDVALGQQHRLVRPHGPVGHQHHPVLVLVYDALTTFQLFGQVVDEQRPAVFQQVLLLCAMLCARFVRQKVARPYLAVRMRIGAADDGALVLEQLHPVVDRAELRQLFYPAVDHFAHICQIHRR